MLPLAGKTALVTGASSGIGAAVSRRLAADGADLVLLARDPGRLAAVATETGTPEARTLRHDLVESDDLIPALADLPPIDIVVHAAGVARHAPFMDVTPEDFDLTLAVNVRAAFFLTQALVRRCLDEGRPCTVISISSQMGHVGGPDRTVYCTSKHAIEGFSKALAVELGHRGIRSVTVCPTFVDTPLARQTLDDPVGRAWIEGSIPAGRLVKPEEVAAAVAYLARDEATMVNGSSLIIDGGWTAR